MASRRKMRDLVRLERAASDHQKHTAMAHFAKRQLMIEEAKQARITALVEAGARREERATMLADAWGGPDVEKMTRTTGRDYVTSNVVEQEEIVEPASTTV